MSAHPETARRLFRVVVGGPKVVECCMVCGANARGSGAWVGKSALGGIDRESLERDPWEGKGHGPQDGKKACGG